MASVKNLKSKGRARLGDFESGSPLYDNVEYTLRKQQFADRPAAKIMKPVRLIRQVYTEALKLWDAGNKGGAYYPFPYRAEQWLKVALRMNGHPVVQRIAAAA